MEEWNNYLERLADWFMILFLDPAYMAVNAVVVSASEEPVTVSTQTLNMEYREQHKTTEGLLTVIAVHILTFVGDYVRPIATQLERLSKPDWSSYVNQLTKALVFFAYSSG